MRSALAEAAEYPHARPWYRAVYAGVEPIGFVMVSWRVEPQPPDIIGPWFLRNCSSTSGTRAAVTVRRLSARSLSSCGLRARRR